MVDKLADKLAEANGGKLGATLVDGKGKTLVENLAYANAEEEAQIPLFTLNNCEAKALIDTSASRGRG